MPSPSSPGAGEPPLLQGTSQHQELLPQQFPFKFQLFGVCGRRSLEMALKPGIGQVQILFPSSRGSEHHQPHNIEGSANTGVWQWAPHCPQHCCVSGGGHGTPKQPCLGQALSWDSDSSDCAAQQRSQGNWRSHGSTGDPSRATQTGWMVAGVPCTHSLELGLPPPRSHEALDWEHPNRDGFSPSRCFKFVVNPYLFGLIIAGSPPIVPGILQ